MSGVRKPTFDRTDSGNAERVAYNYGERLRYVPEWRRFVVWNGAKWEDDPDDLRVSQIIKDDLEVILKEAVAASKEAGDDDEARKAAKAVFSWYHECRSRKRRNATAALLRAEPGLCVAPESFDRNPWLLGVRNGTLNLKNGVLAPAQASDLITKVAPVKYGTEAKAPEWDKFLETVLPNPEIRAFLQRFVGYCLTGNVGERLFVVLFGRGRNGKSVLLRTLQTILGPYAIAAAPGLLMSRDKEPHPTELADLCGTRLVVASEMKKGRTFDEEQVKRLTGDDRVKARRMREDFWEFDPTHKFVIATNHRPRVVDATDSFWDRVALVPFTVRIPDKAVDTQLRAKLDMEKPGIFNWCVQGCLEWQRIGLATPKEVTAAVREYRDGEDRLGQFIAERLIFDAETYTLSSAELSSSVKSWCDEHNIRPFADRDVAERLQDGGAAKHRTAVARGWKGVRLRRREDTPAIVPEALQVVVPGQA